MDEYIINIAISTKYHNISVHIWNPSQKNPVTRENIPSKKLEYLKTVKEALEKGIVDITNEINCLKGVKNGNK